MLILGIETSCDETAVAIVKDGREIISQTVLSQIPIHASFGGVVPENASRLHCENILDVYNKTLNESKLTLSNIDAIAVTNRPGLIGALLVGVNFAKGICYSCQKPLIPVHHLAGHIASCYLAFKELAPPFLGVIASGGHTIITIVKDYNDFKILGSTTDDAAGEAFDKAARVLGFSYPGGKFIDECAKKGDSNFYKFPKPKTENPLDFSFSGLKTAVLNLVNNSLQKDKNFLTEKNINNICASFQKTVAEIFYEKILTAAKRSGMTKIAFCGGAAANSGIRNKLLELPFEVFIPPHELCGDNAAMIAAAAFHTKPCNDFLNLNAYASAEING